MVLKIRFILVGSLLLLRLLSSGQSLSHTYDVQMILPEEISQHTFISGLAEDPAGFLWLSSYKGLSCYDGHQIIHYNNQNTTDSLFLTSEGRGYKTLCTPDGGLHLWTAENKTRNIIVFNTKDRKITNTYSRAEVGGPWLFAAHENVYTVTETENDLEIRSVTRKDFTTIKIKNDRVNLVADFSKSEQKVFTKKYVLSIDSTGRLSKTANTRGSAGIEIDKFRSDAKLKYWVKYYPEYDDHVWLTDRLREIYFWNAAETRLEHYTPIIDGLAKKIAPSALKGSIQSILKTRQGLVYVMYSHALVLLKPKLPTEEELLEPIFSGKPFTSMRGITEDESGNIYASFYTGIAMKKKGRDEFEEFRNTLSIPKDKEATYSLTYHDDKLIWNSSVFDLYTGDVSFIEHPFHGVHVNHVVEKDTLWSFFWFTRLFAKHVFTTQETTSQHLFPNIESNTFSDLEQDENGKFWATTGRNGLLHFDRYGKQIKIYSIEELGLSYEDDYLYGLYLEKDRVYFGSQRGLEILDLETDSHTVLEIQFSNSKGELKSRIVYFIEPDGEGNLYLGTNYGLVLYHPKTNKFKTLVRDHPLANKEFNRNSSYRSRDGRFYFGTVDGLYSFLPEDLIYEKSSRNVPPPTIFRLQMYDGKLKREKNLIHNWSNKKEIRLNPTDRNFLLEFSSPFDSEVFYSYRVLGLQEEWSPLSTSGKMEIYALPHGAYTVELKAQRGPLDISDSITQLSLIKSQHWYLRWWAFLLYFLTIGSLIYLFFRSRYQRKLAYERKMNDLRIKISSDLHDDVGSLLGGLAIQSELMAKTVASSHQPKLRELSATSREAMDLMRDTVWAIDSRKDKYENLLDRMRHFVESTLRRKEIDYTFEVESINGKMKIDPRLRRNIYLIFKEAIINVTKHSDADQVSIKFKKSEHGSFLSITDNGSITNNDISSDGQGLNNMKMRAKQIGGEVILSQEGGFEVRLEF